MFALSKKSEYGLMALAYLSGLGRENWANVSEIATASAVPRELLAKILSELVRAGLAESASGPLGGFRLARPPAAVSLGDILRALEKKPGMIDCALGRQECRRPGVCSIRGPMFRVHEKVSRVFEETKLADLMTAYEVE